MIKRLKKWYEEYRRKKEIEEIKRIIFFLAHTNQIYYLPKVQEEIWDAYGKHLKYLNQDQVYYLVECEYVHNLYVQQNNL